MTATTIDRYRYLQERKICIATNPKAYGFKHIRCPKNETPQQVSPKRCLECPHNKGLILNDRYVLCETDIRWKK